MTMPATTTNVCVCVCGLHYTLRLNCCKDCVVAYTYSVQILDLTHTLCMQLQRARYLLKARFSFLDSGAMWLPLLLALFTYKYSICVHFIYDCTADNSLIALSRRRLTVPLSLPSHIFDGIICSWRQYLCGFSTSTSNSTCCCCCCCCYSSAALKSD